MSFHLRAVNWRDGMALQENDFRSERFSFEERVRWVARHCGAGYGLVPSAPGVADPLLVESQVADGKLTVHLNRCIAVAPDGSLIHVDATIAEDAGGTPAVTLVLPLTGRSDGRVVHVFVQAAGPRFVEYGPPADGEPARPAWCHADYQLKALDELPTGAPNLFEVARFRVEGQEAMRLEAFIPPCLAVGSFPKLRERAEEVAGRLQYCRDTAVQAVQKLIEERKSRGDAALATVPAETFLQQLALLSSDAFSRIVDPGSNLPPRELVAVGRRFLRGVQALLDAHPDVRRGRWDGFLKAAGRSVPDHVAFRREIETGFRGPVPQHPIEEALQPVTKLVKLVADFPASGFLGESQIPDEQVPAGQDSTDYVYHGKTYYHVPYVELVYHQKGEFHYLDLRGVPPRPGGRFLVFLRSDDAAQRRLAGTLRCGGPDKRSYIWMNQQVPDVEFDPRGILLTLDLEPGQVVDTVHIACRSEDMDLGRMKTTPGEDIILYHKPA